MAYDLHGGWEKFTGHQAPLMENDPDKTLNVVSTVGTQDAVYDDYTIFSKKTALNTYYLIVWL